MWLEIWLEPDLAGFPKNGRISDCWAGAKIRYNDGVQVCVKMCSVVCRYVWVAWWCSG